MNSGKKNAIFRVNILIKESESDDIDYDINQE